MNFRGRAAALAAGLLFVLSVTTGAAMWRFDADGASSASAVKLYDGAVSISLLEPLQVCADPRREQPAGMVILCYPSLPLSDQRMTGRGMTMMVWLNDPEQSARLGYDAAKPDPLQAAGTHLAAFFFRQVCYESLECLPERTLSTEFRSVAGRPAIYVRAVHPPSGLQELVGIGLDDGGLLIVAYPRELDEARAASHHAQFEHIVGSLLLRADQPLAP